MEMLIRWMCIYFTCIMHTCLTTSVNKLEVLVFGGNGFIGAETVERILSENHTVTLINRGNWYWDSELRIKPLVKHIQCDRFQLLINCLEIKSLLNSDESLYFDFVVDFSAFYPFQIADALETFKGKFGKYIYISTDSVYEVCEKTHDGFTVETDSVRPKDIHHQQDEYGDNKLKCEEVLIQAGVPHLILRLPDVIGPRDNSYRWWSYQLWIKLSGYLVHTVSIPKRLFYKPLSFVYVKDVANLILRSFSLKEEVFNEAYNLAFSEVKTLYQLLSLITHELDKGFINVMLDERYDYFYLYPSVTTGPINIEKANKRLDWQPTPFETAVRETVLFYEEAISNISFAKEAEKIIEKVKFFFTDNWSELYRGLEIEYGIQFHQRKDEL